MKAQDYSNFEALEFASNYASANPAIRFLLKRFDRRLKAALSALQPALKTVLEVGSGEGYSTGLIRSSLQSSSTLVSSDLIPDLVQRSIQRSGRNNNLVQNIHSLAVRTNAVDLVIALEVMEHLPEPETALRELARVTARCAIITVPFEPWWRVGNMLRGAYWNDWGNTPDHLNHWGRNSLAEFLRQRFERVHVTVSFPWLIAICEQPYSKETAP